MDIFFTWAEKAEGYTPVGAPAAACLKEQEGVGVSWAGEECSAGVDVSRGRVPLLRVPQHKVNTVSSVATSRTGEVRGSGEREAGQGER